MICRCVIDNWSVAGVVASRQFQKNSKPHELGFKAAERPVKASVRYCEARLF